MVVVDRASGAARETSFANGGQISVSQSEPWANPRAPWRVLSWLLRDDAPLLFRPRLDARQWRWGLDFLRECMPGRSERNMRQMVALGLYSRDTLRGAPGTGHRLPAVAAWHSDFAVFAGGTGAGPERLRTDARAGCGKSLLTPLQALEREPALARIQPELSGACWSPDDESGNVHLFTVALAQACALRGVEFRFQTRINALECADGAVSGVSVTAADGAYGRIEADAYVLALGSYSPLLAAQAGLRLPVYPARAIPPLCRFWMRPPRR